MTSSSIIKQKHSRLCIKACREC
ncbi:four-helix bundle copper-binding protein [Limosilactobacillus viscerum]